MSKGDVRYTRIKRKLVEVTVVCLWRDNKWCVRTTGEEATVIILPEDKLLVRPTRKVMEAAIL